MVTRSLDPTDGAPDSAAWLLAQDGVAAAQLVAYDEADGEMSAARPQVNQGSGTWTGWFGGNSWSGVVLARAVGDRQRFDPLTSAELGRGLDLHEDRLPAGWTVIEDPEGVLTAAFTGSPSPRSTTAVATRVDTSHRLPTASVMTIRVEDAAAALDLVDSFAGGPPGEQHFDLGTGPQALLVDHVTTGGSSVVWSPGPGMVVVASATILTDEDLSVDRPFEPPGVGGELGAADAARESRAVRGDVPRAGRTPGRTRPGERPQRCHPARRVLGPGARRRTSSSLTTGDRRRVADAVRADREGFDRILATLTEAERAPLITMRDVALEPERIDEHAADDEVRTAAFLVTTLGRAGCGFA